jgi:hypothetical protein
MGNELDAYVYDYDAGGNDGCPLLVLTPVEESCHLFCRGRGGGGWRRCSRRFQLGFQVGLGDDHNIDDNPTPSAVCWPQQSHSTIK